MVRFALFSVLVGTFFTGTANSQNLERRCEPLLASLEEPLPETPIKDLSDSEFDRISSTRPCVKTYPWPEGIFFVDTNEDSAITSSQMRLLRQRVDELIEEFESGKILATLLLNNDDETVKIFYYWSKEGWDHSLLRKYGYFLEIQTLLREGKVAEAEVLATNAVERWDIVASDNIWDVGDDNTYFSDSSLNNLLSLLHYKASAAVGPDTLDAAFSVTESYIESRSDLRYEIGLIGDPIWELVSNTACF